MSAASKSLGKAREVGASRASSHVDQRSLIDQCTSSLIDQQSLTDRSRPCKGASTSSSCDGGGSSSSSDQLSAVKTPISLICQGKWSCSRCRVINNISDSLCYCGERRPPEALPFHQRAKDLRAEGCYLPEGIAPRDGDGRSSSGFAAHTILILDNSGSMRLKDVQAENGALYRRCDALLHVLTRDLIDKQLAQGATPSDRVSLIKMESDEDGRGDLSMRNLVPGVRQPFALLPLDADLSKRLRTALHSRSRAMLWDTHCILY